MRRPGPYERVFASAYDTHPYAHPRSLDTGGAPTHVRHLSPRHALLGVVMQPVTVVKDMGY